MNLGRGNISKSRVIRSVERLVCDCVNKVFAQFPTNKYSQISTGTLYEGVTNIPLTRRIARSAVFVVLHDRFGFSYNTLSEYSCLTANSIIKAVSKYKNTPDSDDVVKKTNELIDIELEKFPIV